jgi:hypothetical protein
MSALTSSLAGCKNGDGCADFLELLDAPFHPDPQSQASQCPESQTSTQSLSLGVTWMNGVFLSGKILMSPLMSPLRPCVGPGTATGSGAPGQGLYLQPQVWNWLVSGTVLQAGGP